MSAESVVLVDGRVVGKDVSASSIATALRAADEFVRVRRGSDSIDAAPVDGRWALVVTDPSDRRAARAAGGLASFDEAVAALSAFGSVETARAPSGGFAAQPVGRETRTLRSVVLPLILIAIGTALAVLGARTEQASATADPHPAALIGGLVCFVAFLAVMLMFTLPYVMHRLERRFDVEIRNDSLHAGWRVVDPGRYGAKVVVSLVALILLLSILIVPLIIVIGAVAVR